MRGTVAKRLRKEAYGGEQSIRHRDYDHIGNSGIRVATGSRKIYQDLKKSYKRK